MAQQVLLALLELMERQVRQVRLELLGCKEMLVLLDQVVLMDQRGQLVFKAAQAQQGLLELKELQVQLVWELLELQA
jgi:hypothetical protein